MNYLLNLPSDIFALIVAKISPIDLQYLRSTCHQMRNILDEKVIEKLYKNLERIHCQLIDELEQSLVECKIKEDILDKEVREEIEILKEKAKSDDIKSGDYDEERDGEYEFIMYDDDIEEEIYSPFSYLKGKRETKYKVFLLGESFDFWIHDLMKIEMKIKSSTHHKNRLSPCEDSNINVNLPLQMCDRCKSECISPHLQFNKSICSYNYCYHCVLNNKSKFIKSLLEQSSPEKLMSYAVNYNVLRIMSGMGGFAYAV
jgi:F-box domain